MIVTSEGNNRHGANDEIWPTYVSDMIEVRPVDKTPLTSIEHNELMLEALLESSPEENCLKNLAGKDISRIMTAASTEIEVLIEMRCISRLLIASMN